MFVQVTASEFKINPYRDFSGSLENEEHLKQTQVADLMDALKIGNQFHRAYHVRLNQDVFHIKIVTSWNEINNIIQFVIPILI